ncbi:MAG TPA: hypothetical protein VII23_03430 [Terriglobales bacterium]
MAIVIRRLEEHDVVENFDCGDDALNNYLKRHAWANQEKSSIGVSYVAVDEGAPRTVLGYFTLAMLLRVKSSLLLWRVDRIDRRAMRNREEPVAIVV